MVDTLTTQGEERPTEATENGAILPPFDISSELERHARRAREIELVRRHYERNRGYRAVSGLQFGTDLVLYADDPSVVHSDFCVNVIPGGKDGAIDWRNIQTLVRQMPDLHKTLILTYIKWVSKDEAGTNGAPVVDDINDVDDGDYEVCEIAITSEHAPFRHKKSSQPELDGAGLQLKKKTKYQR